jgi:hypothetical protein
MIGIVSRRDIVKRGRMDRKMNRRSEGRMRWKNMERGHWIS